MVGHRIAFLKGDLKNVRSDTFLICAYIMNLKINHILSLFNILQEVSSSCGVCFRMLPRRWQGHTVKCQNVLNKNLEVRFRCKPWEEMKKQELDERPNLDSSHSREMEGRTRYQGPGEMGKMGN